MKFYNSFKNIDWKNLKIDDVLKNKELIEELVKSGSKDWGKVPAKITPESLKVKQTKRGGDPMSMIQKNISDLMLEYGNYNQPRAPIIPYAQKSSSGAPLDEQYVSIATLYNLDIKEWDYPVEQPAKIPNRKGLLTHPAWLIAHSQNSHTDPVTRGKWIREKLLAGTVPDVPITVDAKVSENPHKTFRERFDDTVNNESCWKCHVKMNPLGYPFEIFDDFGRYRTEEPLENDENLLTTKIANSKKTEETVRYSIWHDSRIKYKTLPVNAKGVLDDTGDPKLDGEVKDAFELIDRLAKSSKVRQSIIRHAFRFFLGRNEMLSDSKTLIDAEQAYLKNGGSFDAVIISLLTSDSFIYRKEINSK